MPNENRSLEKRPLTVLFMSALLVCLVVSSLPHISGGNTSSHDIPTRQIDLDMTHTITCIYSPSPYNGTYIFHGEMRIGCIDIDRLTGDSHRAYYKFLIHVIRSDTNPNVEILSTAIILIRTSGTTRVYPNSTLILLAGGADATVELTWGETGGGVVDYMGEWLGKTWTIGARALCTNTTAYDNKMANNEIMTGGNYTAYSQLTGLGDFNGDGVIDVYDALQLSAHFGESIGDPRWNPEINMSPVPEPSTGLQTIDIFDAIYFARFFGFGYHRP